MLFQTIDEKRIANDIYSGKARCTRNEARILIKESVHCTPQVSTQRNEMKSPLLFREINHLLMDERNYINDCHFLHNMFLAMVVLLTWNTFSALTIILKNILIVFTCFLSTPRVVVFNLSELVSQLGMVLNLSDKMLNLTNDNMNSPKIEGVCILRYCYPVFLLYICAY